MENYAIRVGKGGVAYRHLEKIRGTGRPSGTGGRTDCRTTRENDSTKPLNIGVSDGKKEKETLTYWDLRRGNH